MQRCPYIHEMRERLISPQSQVVGRSSTPDNMERESLISSQQQPPDNNNPVGTVVKLNADGYGSYISPTHNQQTPLVPRDLGEDFTLELIDDNSRNPRLPKNAKTSLFIITSLVYAMLLVVICVAYVISDVSTRRLPVMYYEGFFTYLYGMSIFFLLYVFCFLLQESSCCSGEKEPKEPKPKKEKPKKGDKGKDGKDNGKGGSGKPSPYQEKKPQKKRDLVRQKMSIELDEEDQGAVEVAEKPVATPKRKRKTTQTDTTHGSFFLRVGAIAFGLGTMIYIGVELGRFFEIPFTSPCHQILRGINPLLQMIFTFMQMYFIFMNARLNIHRFKVLARFGLMHIAATNICVWIRTLVLESLREITTYHRDRGITNEEGIILESIRRHTLNNANVVMGLQLEPDNEWEPISANLNAREGSNVETPSSNVLSRIVKSTVEAVTTTTTTEASLLDRMQRLPQLVNDHLASAQSTPAPPPSSTLSSIYSLFSSTSAPTTSTTVATTTSIFNNLFGFENNAYQTYSGLSHNVSDENSVENFESLVPQSLLAVAGDASITSNSSINGVNCGHVDIMGDIVKNAVPYLYPFVIEYSLIGAVVIYVIWRQIGRYPKYTNDEDLERRLEIMLSRRAVALAQVQRTGRVDCVGASKGLFFGLLLLVGALICLILFFVLIRHDEYTRLAIYLADSSHCVLMAFSLVAILIGFIRVQGLKFKCEEGSNLNDILLRISAFGLFIYAIFSIISGALNALESEPKLLVTVTNLLVVIQVVFQLLFIGDVSRRRVHLPEHDRTKPGRQIVTFLLICNIAMYVIYSFEAPKVVGNPVQSDFYGFIAWSLIQRVTLPLCIFHRFHSAVTLAEIWKTSYKARLE